MSKIILVAGYVAGGKTTFSLRLSQSLNIPVFNKDKIKSVLGNYIKINNREESKNLSRATFGIMAHITENLMKTGIPFILESNFIDSEAAILNDLISKYNYKTLSYVFVGDLHIIHKRFIERDNSPEREASNRIHGLLDDYSVFEEGIMPLGKFNIEDKIVKVDTTTFENVDFESYIKETHEFINAGGNKLWLMHMFISISENCHLNI